MLQHLHTRVRQAIALAVAISDDYHRLFCLLLLVIGTTVPAAAQSISVTFGNSSKAAIEVYPDTQTTISETVSDQHPATDFTAGSPFLFTASNSASVSQNAGEIGRYYEASANSGFTVSSGIEENFNPFNFSVRAQGVAAVEHRTTIDSPLYYEQNSHNPIWAQSQFGFKINFDRLDAAIPFSYRNVSRSNTVTRTFNGSTYESNSYGGLSRILSRHTKEVILDPRIDVRNDDGSWTIIQTGWLLAERINGELNFTMGAGGGIGYFGRTGRGSFYDGQSSHDILFTLGLGSRSDTPILPTAGVAAPVPQIDDVMPSDEQVSILPAPPSVFENVPSDRWFDPVAADGFHYVMEDGALFTEVIDFADGFADPFRVFAQGQELGSFGQDDSVDFVDLLGHGVSAFTVLGINPTVDGEDPLAFPIQLAFDTNTATFAQYALTTDIQDILGDLNGDGALSNGDIASFVQALTDPAGYALANPDLDPNALGDFNGDGLLTNGDIAGFVAALTGGDASGSAVPEPGSLALLALGGLMATRRRRG